MGTIPPVTEALTEYAVGTDFASLPPEVVERTERIVFDEMCCAVLGRELDAGALIATYSTGLGGVEEATVLGTRQRVPAPWAALANGTAGHADEFDGAHVTGGHPGAVVVHAAVATAESVDAGGADVVNAVVLGYDVGTRLVRAVGGSAGLRRRFKLHSDFLHGFGAAAASARILRLSQAGHRHAAALTSGQAIGLTALMDERRHLSKALVDGQASYAGASAARLAAIGFEGNDAVYEAPNGVLDAWGADGAETVLLDGLGNDFAVMGSNFKFYSAGYPIHAPIEAALILLERHAIPVEDVERITVSMDAHTADIVDGRSMPTINLQLMLAVAMVHGGMGFETAHSQERRADPRVGGLVRRIEVERLNSGRTAPPYSRGAAVTLHARDREPVTHRVDHPRGHSLRGEVTWDDLHTKWNDLMTERIGARTFDQALDRAMRLHEAETMSELTSLFVRKDLS